MPRSVRIPFPCFAPAFQVDGHPPAWLLITVRSIPFLPVFHDEASAAAFAAARHAGLSAVPLADPSALRNVLVTLRMERAIPANVLFHPGPVLRPVPIAHMEAVRPRECDSKAARTRKAPSVETRRTAAGSAS